MDAVNIADLTVSGPLLLAAAGFTAWWLATRRPAPLGLAGVLAVAGLVVSLHAEVLTALALSVVLVLISAVALWFFFHWVIPGIGLATGIALGAIVSPTDAVATSIAKRMGAPARVTAVLEGESMLNDASALVLLRAAVAAIASTVSCPSAGWRSTSPGRSLPRSPSAASSGSSI